MAGPSKALSAAYDKRLRALRKRAEARTLTAFESYALKRDWDDLIGDLYVAWTSGQLDALAAADMMSAATILESGGDLPTRSLIREQFASRTSGRTAVLDVLEATRRVIGNRRLNGYSYVEAFAQSARWLDGAISGDVDRVARDSLLSAANGPDQRLVGWQRIPEPGACAFCRALSTRGPVYKSEASALASQGKRYHNRCRCRVEAVAGEFAIRRRKDIGEAEWKRMLATGDVPKIKGRAASLIAKDVNLTRSWTLQREQLAALIPEYQARVAAGDTAAAKPLAWQQNRVAELDRLLSAAAAA
jgi:hypothetical protein